MLTLPFCIDQVKKAVSVSMTSATPPRITTVQPATCGGSINRKEMVMGLFALGVWLHPSESDALIQQLDSDGGGEIELDELQDFWNNYIFDGWK